MEKYKDLTELLEKNELNTEDQKKLSQIISDPEMRDYYYTYLSLKKALFKQSHISTDDLSNYILIKYDREFAADNIIARIPDIEMHLRQCEQCSDEFELLNKEYLAVDEFVKTKIPGKSATKTKKGFLQDILSPTSTYFRAVTMAIVLIGVVYFSMLGASEIFVPVNKKLAYINDKVDNYLTRGRISDEFQKGLISLENRNYDYTIRYLKSDIANNSSDETIFYSHYILGLVYLEEAQTDILGLFPAYNSDNVQNGIHSLKESVNKNTSGRYSNIEFDAYFFIGKAYLMLDNTSEAKKYFEMVINNKGSKMQEARNILTSLHS